MTLLQSLLLSGLFLVIGVVLGFFYSKTARQNRKEIEELKLKLDQAEEEHQHYRKNVGEHFTRTAELVNVMTGSYQAVFEHLRQGAVQLCMPGNLIEDTSWKQLQNSEDLIKNNEDPFIDDELEEEISLNEDDDTIVPKDYSNHNGRVDNTLN